MAQGQSHDKPTDFTITPELWDEAAKRAGFRVTEPGCFWVDKLGMLGRVPCPHNGDHEATVKVLAFIVRAVAEMCKNRIGQSLNGISFDAAIARAMTTGEAPGTRSNDAFESIYVRRIAALLDQHKGWSDSVVAAMPKGQKAERASAIDDNAKHKPNRQKHYQVAVDAAVTAGRGVAPVRAKARRTTTPSSATEL